MNRTDPSQEDDLTLRARARIGQMLEGKWRLDALLGVGGMAAVYAATHRNGKRVAIKVLHGEVALSDEARTRFLREGHLANSVGHAGAVSVLDDAVTEDGSVFLVMDLLEGETLDHRLRRKGRLDPNEVLGAAYHLLDVLEAAHAKGIVHRDVKPENVFLTKDAQVKVLDFGIARIRELTADSANLGATRAGHTMGTPSFMPPEQARGRWTEVDAQSDLWAVGATMFTLLTDKYVHEADTINETLLAAMTLPAKSLALYRPDLPSAVVKVVDRALAFEKSERFANATEMKRAVHLAVRESRGEEEAAVSRAPTLAATSVHAHVIAAHLAQGESTTARPMAYTTGEAGQDDSPDTVRKPRAWQTKATRAAAAIGAAMGVAMAAFVMRGGHETVTSAHAATAQVADVASTGSPPTTPPPPLPEPVPVPTGTSTIAIDPPAIAKPSAPASASAPAHAPAPASAPASAPAIRPASSATQPHNILDRRH